MRSYRLFLAASLALVTYQMTLADDTVMGLFSANPGIYVEATPTSYVYGANPPNGSYPDTNNGGTELINNIRVVGSGTGIYTDPQWIGVVESPDLGNPQPRVTFDFGVATSIDRIIVNYYDNAGSAGIQSPTSMLVSASNDNVTFNPVGTYTGFLNTPPGGFVRDATYDFAATTGRYFRLDFNNPNQWTFLSEVEFFSFQASLTPEPGSVALFAAAMGIAGFAIWRSKRRRLGA